MMKKYLTLLLPLVFVSALYAAEPIVYQVSFDNAVHHEAEISATFSGVKTDILELRMSRSSPGRYAIHEFAKNVYQLSVVDGKGKILTFTRPNPYQWNVEGHDGTVTVTYTLYADHADGTYSAIDRTHAHLNIPATFIWARGFDKNAVEVNFTPFDPKWKVASQLVATKNKYRFTAPNFQYFMDSPVELSNFDLRSWTVKSRGKQYTINLAVHHEGTAKEMDKFTEKAKAITATQAKIFGEYPDFDYGSYTFISCFLPHVKGDGMEHRNSTVLTIGKSFDEADFSQQGVLAHEFLHAWNAERIRPKSLEPFNFEGANMSAELWFVEGFTSYYTHLSLLRAQEIKRNKQFEGLAKTINAIRQSPGKQMFSAEGMSKLAPFRDAAIFIDKSNFNNSLISHYTIGYSIAIALDLSLRSEFDDSSVNSSVDSSDASFDASFDASSGGGLGLDDYMALVWQKYGRSEIPYDNNDLRITLGELVNDQAYADQFFEKYITGKEIPDYKSLLANAGLTLKIKNEDQASLGKVKFEFNGPEAIVSSATIKDSPLYIAGLDNGDQIIALDHRKIRSESLWEKALSKYKPGDTATIHYIQRGVTSSSKITFIEDPELEIVTFKSEDKKETEAMIKFRDAWLGEEAMDNDDKK
ncbi:MAG: M61 family metallopeptidase [Alteromonadaceae bacterium]|nr:M61 family metallopeptidase [Alteromonadaceae bacterium]